MTYADLQKGRVSLTNHAYHVTIVTQSREPIFKDNGIAEIAISKLKHSDQTGEIRSLAWVVMPDHIHWLLQLNDTLLSEALQKFKGRSARAINQQNHSTGTVWQKGFHDHAMRNDESLKETARYIVANPLRARLVKNIQDYPYWWAIWMDDPAEMFE